MGQRLVHTAWVGLTAASLERSTHPLPADTCYPNFSTFKNDMKFSQGFFRAHAMLETENLQTNLGGHCLVHSKPVAIQEKECISIASGTASSIDVRLQLLAAHMAPKKAPPSVNTRACLQAFMGSHDTCWQQCNTPRCQHAFSKNHLQEGTGQQQ